MVKDDLRYEIRKNLTGELRDLLLHLLDDGVRMRRTRRGLQVFSDAEHIVQLHFSPSDHRSDKNALAALKRAGLTKED